MNATHDLERRIADYYATEAPSRAPDWLLARALDTIDTTPQRRTGLGRPWRIPPMPSFAKLVVGAIAIVTITAIGLTVLRPPAFGPAAPASPEPPSSPSASPEPSSSPSAPLPPPLTERFDSALNGISMDYPAGWQTRPATEPWTSRVLTFGESDVDLIFDPELREDLYFAVASEALGGRPDHEWREDVFNAPGDLCGGSGGAGGSYTLDGASGWIIACAGARILLVATDTRGYAIVLHLGDEGLADTYGDT